MRLGAFGLVTVALAALPACGDDDPADGAGGSGGTSSTGTATAVSTDCSVDGDCQIISDCCLGCVAASANADAPMCGADCFQDPCTGEYGPQPNGLSAACDGGTCVLVPPTDTSTGTQTGTNSGTATGTGTGTSLSTSCSSAGECEIISDCCLGCISIEAGQTIPDCQQTCIIDPCEGVYGQGAMLSTTCNGGMCGISVQ